MRSRTYKPHIVYTTDRKAKITCQKKRKIVVDYFLQGASARKISQETGYTIEEVEDAIRFRIRYERKEVKLPKEEKNVPMVKSSIAL